MRKNERIMHPDRDDPEGACWAGYCILAAGAVLVAAVIWATIKMRMGL